LSYAYVATENAWSSNTALSSSIIDARSSAATLASIVGPSSPPGAANSIRPRTTGPAWSLENSTRLTRALLHRKRTLAMDGRVRRRWWCWSSRLAPSTRRRCPPRHTSFHTNPLKKLHRRSLEPEARPSSSCGRSHRFESVRFRASCRLNRPSRLQRIDRRRHTCGRHACQQVV